MQIASNLAEDANAYQHLLCKLLNDSVPSLTKCFIIFNKEILTNKITRVNIHLCNQTFDSKPVTVI